MSDKQVRKHKERASRLTAKGKHDEALAEYQKAIRFDPKDLSLRQKLAESFSRLGKKEEAIREYQSVAGSYAADGLLLKSIAICKVILSLDPSHTETQGALADLYTQKRGDLARPVTMPKSMSAALGKRSASEIRGVPAVAIAPPQQAGREIELPEDEVIDVDEDDGIEVISVEAALVGTPLDSSLGALASGRMPEPLPMGEEGEESDDLEISQDLDIVVEDPDDEPPALVMGTALSSGEGLPVVDDEDGDLLDIAEPAEIVTEDLPPIPLFSDLPRDAFIALTERMELVQAEPGEILIAEGEYASSMYIVIQGRVKVVREVEGGEELKLAELGDGSFFGEMALLSEAPRTASVIAVEETMLFEISRSLMEDITRDYSSVEQVMKRFHRNRLLTNLLRTSPIFAPFSPRDKKQLIEKFKSRSVEAGKLLITKDKPGDGLYVLLSGRCEVLARQDVQDRDVVLAELKEGDVFGEMSLLFRKFATASVRTTSPCIVLRLPKRSFDELIMTHPQVLETLSRLSEERSRFNSDLLGGDKEEALQDFGA